MLWHKWLLLGAIPVAGLVLMVGAWSMISSRSVPPAAVPVAETTPVQPPVEKPETPPPEKPEVPPPVSINRRWLPENTKLLVNLRLSDIAGRANLAPAMPLVEPIWQSSGAIVLKAFGLRAEAVRQMTWASTDLADWPNPGVVVLQLGESQDAGALGRLGEPAPLQLDGASCRRLKTGWTHPFAVLDAQTIVTGREDVLRQLAEGEKKLKSRAIDRFLKSVVPQSDLLGIVNLTAAREAGWQLPVTLFDVWPAGRKPWHVVWESPQAIAVALREKDHTTGELALVCEGETAADQVQAAVAQWVAAAKPALDAKLQSLAANPEIKPYASLLEQAKAALQLTRWQVAEETVWIRIDGSTWFNELVASLPGSQTAIEADWHRAALVANEKKTQELLAGLTGYQRAEGTFPRGASGGALLPPETRLSWIASLLPYLGHRDWHEDLQFGYSWNSPQNRSITRQPLETVTNPALGPSTTEAGFPVTHYVGLAGVGNDAGTLKPDDPRAGVFGYNRSTRPQDIADGASNTIATVGVTGQLGAWSAGGKATVRAFTQRPYVNGPDGFGSGQPNGMLVGMADGSARFVSKDVDPTVLEQLATIGGREAATVAALGPKPEAPAQPSTPIQPKPPAAEAPPAAPEAEPPAKPAPKAVVQGPEPVEIDVEARLAVSMPGFSVPGISLRDALKLVSQLSGVPITIDLDALPPLGVTLEDQITVQLSQTTLKAVLETIVTSRGLAFTIEQSQILVTSPPASRSTLKQSGYTIADLTGNNPVAAAELAGLIERLVAPDSWQTAGGRGRIQVTDDALLVVQTAAVHDQVLTFCEKLRLARGKPLQSPHDPARFQLATKPAQAQAMLNRSVTVNHPEPTPLARIVTDLEAASESQILVNWLALGGERISPQLTGRLKANAQPLAQALEALVQPLGLAYRVVDQETIEITTAKAATSRLELEFYPIGKLVDKGWPMAAIPERITSEVAQGSWSEAGGMGVLAVDEPSRCLIVLQSQPVQALLEASLARWLAEKK